MTNKALNMNNLNEIESKRPARLYGYVKNILERPLTGVKVKCGKFETITLFDGSYRFEVEPGLYYVGVELLGFCSHEKEIFLVDGEEGRLDFQLKEKKGTSKLSGHIINKETGEFLKNGLIYIIRTTINLNSKIDPLTGVYEFNELSSGTYDVWASVLGYEDEKLTITIDEDEEIIRDFQVQKKRDEEVPWG